MKLLAIDGNSILNRAFYGIRPLSNTQGVFTHAIFGFMNIYLKNRDEVQPDAVAVALTCESPRSVTRQLPPIRRTARACPKNLPCSCPM